MVGSFCCKIALEATPDSVKNTGIRYEKASYFFSTFNSKKFFINATIEVNVLEPLTIYFQYDYI